MNVIVIQGKDLVVKNRVDPKLSFKLKGKPRFQKFSRCIKCEQPIPQIKYTPRKYCDDCKKLPDRSIKNTPLKTANLKEYRHQYYLKTVALGWRHY